MILAVERNNDPNTVENLQILEKQPLMGGPLLLTNEAFDHDAEGYESYDSEEPEDESEKEEEEPEEDTSYQKNALVGNAISKKRKASEMLPNSK